MEQANSNPLGSGRHFQPGEVYAFTKGYYRARTDIYTQLFARRLGRALTAGESATLSKQCVTTYGVRRLDDALFDLSPDALAAWLANAAAR